MGIHVGKKGRRYQKQQMGVEFLVVVGRYRVAFRNRGVYGKEGDSKTCEYSVTIASPQGLNSLLVDIQTFEDEDFVVVDHCTGVVVRHGTGRRRER